MAEPKLSTEQRQFDPTERARLRLVMNMVIGNGKPGLNSQIRQLRLICGFILGGIAGLIVEGILILLQSR